LYLASNEGKFDFETQISKEFKSLYDIIIEKQIRIPITQFIRLSSLIPPRYYTIASSSVKHPQNIHLCCSVLQINLPNKSTKTGQCSSFFNRIHTDFQAQKPSKVRIFVKDSTFLLPQDSTFPVIMVGPGAGLAPFRGFIQEKEELEAKNENKTWGELTLFFGCRKGNTDYLYKEELEKAKENGTIVNLHVAFSREQEKRIYVQQLIAQEKEELLKLIFQKNATIYLCGSTEMGKQVMKEFSKLAAAHFKCNLIQSAIKIEEMEKQKRIIKELWG